MGILPRSQYDLVVVGGGIHGVGVAQAAAARGYATLLLEQFQLAAGTSSRSSKLIHGGLRYLEHGQVALVRECLRERGVLLDIAPDLVQLRRFFIPIYRHTRRRRHTVHLGLLAYRVLGQFAYGTDFRWLPRNEWNTLDGLDTEGLLAVATYWDGQTDDEALTHAVMNSALERGAELAMPATFDRAHLTPDGNVLVYYQFKGVMQQVHTRTLVNAGGPWVNDILRRVAPAVPQIQIQLVQGTHIVVTGKLEQGIYYTESPADHRPVFVMPWQGNILVGTTELRHTGRPHTLAPTSAERAYLLETLSYYFPHFRSADTARIHSAFAGLRVLPLANSGLNGLPRETILHSDDLRRPRVLTIYGGKLTAYRATAQRVVDQLSSTLGPATQNGDTKKIKLQRGPLRYSM